MAYRSLHGAGVTGDAGAHAPYAMPPTNRRCRAAPDRVEPPAADRSPRGRPSLPARRIEIVVEPATHRLEALLIDGCHRCATARVAPSAASGRDSAADTSPHPDPAAVAPPRPDGGTRTATGISATPTTPQSTSAAHRPGAATGCGADVNVAPRAGRSGSACAKRLQPSNVPSTSTTRDIAQRRDLPRQRAAHIGQRLIVDLIDHRLCRQQHRECGVYITRHQQAIVGALHQELGFARVRARARGNAEAVGESTAGGTACCASVAC